MGQTLVDRERLIYEDVLQLPRYCDYSPAETYLPIFFGLADPQPGATVLDAGAASGKGALALAKAGLQPTLLDLTFVGLVADAQAFPRIEAPLWARGDERFDYVVCCDVLEHLAQEWTLLAIDRLLQRARYGLFLSIALLPDQFGAWVGRPLHLTVERFEWWRDRLRELGTLVDARDLLAVGVYYLEATT